MGKKIIGEAVTLEWKGNIKKYYTDKGYRFTKYGDEFEVNIKDLSNGSSVEVDVLCDYCNKTQTMSYKNYNNLRADTYCCPECLKHKKKTRDKNNKLIFVEVPYRNKEWLYEEYIVKNKKAEDIAIECGINVRTLREWISIFDFENKYELKKEKISKEIIEELYFKQHKTTEDIGEMFELTGNTVANIIRDFGFEIPTRGELMKIYYDEKGGRERLIKYLNRDDVKIMSSCRQRNISVDEFDDFSTSKAHRLRNNSKYRDWKDGVFQRDNYTCQCCGKRGGNLNAHHILNFSEHEDLIYEVDNGITLCEKCHLVNYPNSFHSLYGERNNTKEQLYEYIENHKSN